MPEATKETLVGIVAVIVGIPIGMAYIAALLHWAIYLFTGLPL